MEDLKKLFNRHPNEVGETYFEHMRMAFRFSLNCAWASIALFIHSFFPFLFRTTGSNIITRLFDEMIKKRLEKKEALRKAKMEENSDTSSDD